MTAWGAFLAALALFVALPVAAYLTAKAIHFGWRRGGQMFDEWSERRARRRDKGKTINLFL